MSSEKNNPKPTITGPVCPVPLTHGSKILMGHGSGGKMMNDLIKKTFLPPLDNPTLRAGDDAGVVQANSFTKLAISTDAHVVSPLFFPGGDIGKLAVCGTVNDVAMLGAIPLYLTAGFILEEGLDISILERIVQSMKESADEAEVKIVAGDTKVVQKGNADGIYITTAGVGIIRDGVDIGGANAKPGDIVILSGTIGDHGIAVLVERGDLGFISNIQSDVAPLNHLVQKMLDVNPEIHVLRDPTRGGVASVLNEITTQSGVGIKINESVIPVNPAVQTACEMLGFDPLYVANEGKLIAIVGQNDVEKTLEAMMKTQYGKDAVIIGEVTESHVGRVLMKTAIGSTRLVDVLMGEMLPRIC
jgi:hydrogenase expression/formation protein HypE